MEWFILQSIPWLLITADDTKSSQGISSYGINLILPDQTILSPGGFTRPTLERRKTLGHIRSINPNMIID